MGSRKVTENDFRQPEFKDKCVDDYEFRADEKVVRKDRWETGIRTIAALFNVSGEFEINDLIVKVKELKASAGTDA